jgi:hypothetical protein
MKIGTLKHKTRSRTPKSEISTGVIAGTILPSTTQTTKIKLAHTHGPVEEFFIKGYKAVVKNFKISVTRGLAV